MVEDINQKIIKLRKEIHLLNSSLNGLDIKKEAKYKEKNDLDERLGALIKAAKALKEQKQNLNDEIKKLKNQREIKNNSVKKLLVELQNLKKDRRNQLKKENILSINDICKKIKNIEFIIQTQAISFKMEKRYMDEIKALKAKEKEVAEIERGFKEITNLKAKIDAERSEADNLHKKIQEMAAINSQLFEDLTNRSKEILRIKEQRIAIISLLRTFKLDINMLNKKLNAVLEHWSDITHVSVGELARKSAKILQEKTEEVKEKFKKKKKLTTEDILILQREAMQE